MKTVLVPIDFSDSTKNVIEAAVDIAQKVKGSVILLHVVEVDESGSFNVESEVDTSISWGDRLFDKTLIKKAQSQLNALKAELETKGIETTALLRLGNPFHSLTSIIIERSADLIIIGAGREDENGMGSAVQKVVRRATIPVLTVSKSIRTDFKSVVLATGLTDAELLIPPALQEILAADNSVVHLLRVNTPGGFAADYKIKDKLQGFVNRLKIKRYTLNIYNDYTEPAGIIHFAESVNADLIAMTTHGRTGFAHMMSGSIAEDVINNASYPVITYPLKALTNNLNL